MKPIHVKRYSNPAAIGYLGVIEPEDRSWIVWVDTEGKPSLWLATETILDESTGKVERVYMPASQLHAIDPSTMAGFERKALEQATSSAEGQP